MNQKIIESVHKIRRFVLFCLYNGTNILHNTYYIIHIYIKLIYKNLYINI
jgi:hypothetical protein